MLWRAVESFAPKIGCAPRTLLNWARRHEVDTGVRDGVTTTEAKRVKERRRANEILKLASAFFAQAELDRRVLARHP